MVSINKNTQSIENTFKFNASELSQEGLDGIFAELFSLVDFSSIEEKTDQISSDKEIVFSIIKPEKSDDSIVDKQLMSKNKFISNEILSNELTQEKEKPIAINPIDTENHKKSEIDAAKSLISIFYQKLNSENTDLIPEENLSHKENVFENKLIKVDHNFLNNSIEKTKKKNGLNDNRFEKENVNEKDERIAKKNITESKEINNSLLGSIVKKNIQSNTNKKKNIFNEKIKIDVTFSEKENFSNQTKNSLMVEHKVPLIKQTLDHKINIEQKLFDEKIDIRKNSFIKTENISNNYNDKNILDMMESNWGEKFVKIIRNNINRGLNKVDLSLEPSNLGKLKVEVSVEGEKTDIKINSENKLVSNILNENYHKLNEMFERDALKLGYFSSMSGNNGNSGNESKNNFKNEKKLVNGSDNLKNEKLEGNESKKTNHNVDINA